MRIILILIYSDGMNALQCHQMPCADHAGPLARCGSLILTLLLLAARGAVGQVGLLVVAHGADSSWNAGVEQTVSQIQWHRGPVRTAYLMGTGTATHSWDAGIASLLAAGARSIVVVPLMVSSFGEHVTQIHNYAGEPIALPSSLAGMAHEHGANVRPPVPTVVTAAIDGAPELGQILSDRWDELSLAQRSPTLVLVAHGPSADSLVAQWLQAIADAATPLARALGAQNVRIGLLRDDAAPRVRANAIRSLRDSITALASRSGDSVTVMTVLISSGTINRVTIPGDLSGMPIRYIGATLAPHPALARWIERVATEARLSVEANSETDHRKAID